VTTTASNAETQLLGYIQCGNGADTSFHRTYF